MSDLETAASAILKPMFDERIHLQLDGGKGQEVVARWAMKTALMLQFTQPQPSIPLPVYPEFYRTKLPPKKAVIYVAHHIMDKMPNGGHSLVWNIGMPTADGGQALQGQMYGVTYFIKNLVVQVVGYVLRTIFDPNVVFDQTFQPYVQLLWPPGRGVEWPTQPSLDDRRLLAFAASLANMRRRTLLDG